jgi:hypothetical protein
MEKHATASAEAHTAKAHPRKVDRTQTLYLLSVAGESA